ncbi:hypothetical protein WT83_16580 [Burkholderia territorii]|uniref:Uncharacterized protein n=1 Tax=Burkholderia territorii TaxID=1503055 RepID=A0A108EPH0_9BURK|nr:hypothetical protein [Burkholderia territorii]KWN14705.1 hypothetical protein WT83_16580 [Burkholderia territorii]
MRLPDPRAGAIEGAQRHVQAVAGEFLAPASRAVEDVAQARGQRSLIAGRDGPQTLHDGIFIHGEGGETIRMDILSYFV